jgi:hypothetical protein
VIWVPQNTVFQHYNTSKENATKLIVSSNRMYNWLGYSNKVDMEAAPEFTEQQSGALAGAKA